MPLLRLETAALKHSEIPWKWKIFIYSVAELGDKRVTSNITTQSNVLYISLCVEWSYICSFIFTHIYFLEWWVTASRENLQTGSGGLITLSYHRSVYVELLFEALTHFTSVKKPLMLQPVGGVVCFSVWTELYEPPVHTNSEFNVTAALQSFSVKGTCVFSSVGQSKRGEFQRQVSFSQPVVEQKCSSFKQLLLLPWVVSSVLILVDSVVQGSMTPLHLHIRRILWRLKVARQSHSLAIFRFYQLRRAIYLRACWRNEQLSNLRHSQEQG